MELIDRKTHSANVVVKGLTSENCSAAKKDFANLCLNNLSVNAHVVNVRKLPPINTFLVTLENASQASNILSSKIKLKGKSIYIQKDYTSDEQKMRYNLRKLNRTV